MPKREYRACCAPIRWQKAASIEGAVISGLQAGKGTGALFGGDRETIGPVHLRNLADIDEKQISTDFRATGDEGRSEQRSSRDLYRSRLRRGLQELSGF
jgi:hypothetical protein